VQAHSGCRTAAVQMRGSSGQPPRRINRRAVLNIELSHQTGRLAVLMGEVVETDLGVCPPKRSLRALLAFRFAQCSASPVAFVWTSPESSIGNNSSISSLNHTDRGRSDRPWPSHHQTYRSPSRRSSARRISWSGRTWGCQTDVGRVEHIHAPLYIRFSNGINNCRKLGQVGTEHL